MKPEDVPQHYVDLAMPAWSANAPSQPGNWSAEGQVRAVLAAVLTEAGTGMAVQRGLYRSAEEDVTELTACLQRAEAALRDLVDPDPCYFDHHGYCQAHSWLQSGRCPHARAAELLAELDREEKP